MEEKNKEQFDRIDAKNLFEQWHKDVRNFTINFNLDCVLKVIKNTPITFLEPSKFNQLENFTNTAQCKSIFNRVVKESKKENFLNILQERDNLFPRYVERKFSIEEILQLVKEDLYHPLLLLQLNEELYIIDGRTRLYCCIFYKVPAKVRIITDYELNENCK